MKSKWNRANWSGSCTNPWNVSKCQYNFESQKLKILTVCCEETHQKENNRKTKFKISKDSYCAN